ncbi:MAG: cytochrome c [Acidobacteriota bacterium]|nr:cytochrome c [Acidobacteriota bacterium]
MPRQIRGFGCALILIAGAARAQTAPTFYRDVLPVLQNRCQECHRAGEIGPMPLTNLRETRPWAKAIREAALTHRMPPWFADPRYGHFANDRALTDAEIHTLAAWAESGAPPGDPDDAPLTRRWPTGWNIGKPDAIFEPPRDFQIPARGDIEYQYVILRSGLTEDRWVQQVEVRPSNRAVVHHAVVYIREPGSQWLRDSPVGVPFSLSRSFTTSDVLMVYTPGNSMDSWPTGMAKKIKAGSDIVIQIHYTATGKAAADRTRVAINYSRTPVQQAVLTLQMGNDHFAIPPGDPEYRVQVSGTLPNDATLLSLFPHMHLRGKSFEYAIADPGGHLETLLRVTRYDFYWQLNYRLAEPRRLPAGTRLLFTATFDNSPNNPRNPDPKAEVHFGEQSWEEMMIGFFDVVVDARMDKQSFFIR